MSDLDLMKMVTQKTDSKIILLVMDGLGGLPREIGGPTELEAASTPNLDELARQGMLGLLHPVGVGISPGSGPGHMGLFGYDPLENLIGRGVLEAVGIGLPLTGDDVAARGNFCTVDQDGLIVDRRAGRIPTERVRQDGRPHRGYCPARCGADREARSGLSVCAHFTGLRSFG